MVGAPTKHGTEVSRELKLIGRLVGNSEPQSTTWVKRRTDVKRIETNWQASTVGVFEDQFLKNYVTTYVIIF
jgi:hypothetical protein